MAKSVTGLSTSFKALQINNTEAAYGAFAEIGAGQEVARHFFQAGHASGTVAKSMSAYDMLFSDEIYGKEESGRYVCESRLDKMLKTEFELVNERLKDSRGKDCQFFAFANTVATNRGHGWVGIEYQLSPLSPPNKIILHVNMLDNTRLQQTEVMGVLGVNLIYGAFNLYDKPEKFISSLTDNISRGRVEIDLIRFTGKDFEHIDNRLMCLELVEQGLTQNVVFDSKGATSTLAENFFHKPVFLLRGEFRPLTKVNVEILESSIAQFEKDFQITSGSTKPILEITMAHLKKEQDHINKKDFLDRVDTLSHLGYSVMISDYNFYYEVKTAIREVTPEPIGMVIGGNQLDYFFDKTNYSHLQNDIFEAASKLFDPKACVYVFPYKTNETCSSLNTFFGDKGTNQVISFLKDRNNLRELLNCDEVESSVLSSHVRKLMSENNPEWKELVPEKLKTLVEERGLFKN